MSEFTLAFLGDIFGTPGRQVVEQQLPALRADHQPELVIANAENAKSGQDDFIQIVQGRYLGNFVYASAQAFDLSILGGYTPGCGARVVNAENTILDGANAGTVLVLSNTQINSLSVDGVTLENGQATTITPGGGQAGMDAIGRMGGQGYVSTRDYFDLPSMSVAEWEQRQQGQATSGNGAAEIAGAKLPAGEIGSVASMSARRRE